MYKLSDLIIVKTAFTDQSWDYKCLMQELACFGGYRLLMIV